MVTNVDEAPEIAGDDIAEDYPENGSNLEVERFRATDPEDRTVYWSLATDADANVDGVVDDCGHSGQRTLHDQQRRRAELQVPARLRDDDGRRPGSNAPANTYKVMVVASDDPRCGVTGRKMAYKKVTVNVTNVEETETVTLSARQPQVGVTLTATYNDLDNEKPDTTNLTWKWYLGRYADSWC